MKKYRLSTLVVVGLLAAGISNFTPVAQAEEKKAAPDAKALAKASQNPLASMISVPFENNATFAL